MRANDSRGMTRIEVAVVLAIIAVLLAVAVPAVGGGRGMSGVGQSMSNLTVLSLGHVLYAADWAGRQITWTRDDLGQYASIAQYNAVNGCLGALGPECHPSIIAGWGQTLGGNVSLWAYWSNVGFSAWAFEPLNFPGQDFLIVSGSQVIEAFTLLDLPDLPPPAVMSVVAGAESITLHVGKLGDLDGDDVVATADFLMLLGSWGPCPPVVPCPADLDGDGAVGTSDMLLLLGYWG